MIPLDKRDFKRLFPALSDELEQSVPSEEDVKNSQEEPLRGFMPGPEDYIMRCTTDEEALGVIEFLRQRGEICEEEFQRLRKQICETGVRSFGPLREDGYYLRTYSRLGPKRGTASREDNTR
ncbi:MAG: DUF2095 family protein [Nitrososphaerota archaeon]